MRENTGPGWLPAAAMAIVFAGFVLLEVAGQKTVADATLQALGLLPYYTPFLDADTIMSALRCARQGVDVLASNPCDPLGRTFDYSPLWLHLAAFPITPAWLVPVGLAVDMLFIAALFWLPAGRSRWQVCVITAAVLSPPAAYALERANNDLIIFVLATVTAALSVRSLPLRLVGLACAFVAGLLKYYPMLLMALALRERLRWFIGITVVSLCGFAVFVWAEFASLVRVLALVPIGSYFGDMFGARTLAFGLAEWIGQPILLGRIGQIVCDVVAIGSAMALRDRLAPDLGRLSARTLGFLLAGALLVLACFHTAQNIGYRAILLIFVIPAFVALAGDGERRLLWALSTIAVIALLWSEAARHWLDILLAHEPISSDTGWPTRHAFQMAAWLLREACWWWVVTMLWSVVLATVGRSRAVVDAAVRLSGAATPLRAATPP